MTKDQAIHYMLHHPRCHVSHPLFDSHEYLYSKGDGVIYDECGYVFENFTGHNDGMRDRCEPVWLSGWKVILGPDPELPDTDPVNVLHQLMCEWGIGSHMGHEDINELVKYLVANGVTVDG